MPWGLQRFQHSHHLHFVTFSCYRRRPFLNSPARRELLERVLEDTRRSYRFFVTGYVVMPEHVHLLVSEPERGVLARAIQAMKQSVARRLALRAAEPVQPDYLCSVASLTILTAVWLKSSRGAFRFFDAGWRAFLSSWSACRCALSLLVRFSAMPTAYAPA